MIQIRNHFGKVEITDAYLASLLSETVSGCFGVVGLATSSTTQGLRSALLKENVPDHGVLVRSSGGELFIDVHIIVTYGVNIRAIVGSIINRVSFTVEEATGLIVKKVNVFVDGIQS